MERKPRPKWKRTKKSHNWTMQAKRQKRMESLNPYEARLNAIARMFPDGVPGPEENSQRDQLEIGTVQAEYALTGQTGAPSMNITYEDLCRAAMCEFCGMTVSKKNRRAHLKAHIVVESDSVSPAVGASDRLYKCQICYEFSSCSLKEAMAHMNTHRIKGFVCQICGISFDKRTDYDLHTISHREGDGTHDPRYLPFPSDEENSLTSSPADYVLLENDRETYVLVQAASSATETPVIHTNQAEAEKDPNEIQPFELSFDEMMNTRRDEGEESGIDARDHETDSCPSSSLQIIGPDQETDSCASTLDSRDQETSGNQTAETTNEDEESGSTFFII